MIISYGQIPNITSLTHSTINVQNSSTEVLVPSSTRTFAYLQNISNEAIYLKFNAAANVSEGIYLAANGGSYEISPAKANLCQSGINAVATNAGKLLLCSSN